MTKKIVIISLSCLALAVGGVVWLFVAFYMSMERGEEHRRHMEEERRSGRDAFGEEPALFAVAQAIVKNDQDAIRAREGRSEFAGAGARWYDATLPPARVTSLGRCYCGRAFVFTAGCSLQEDH